MAIVGWKVKQINLDGSSGETTFNRGFRRVEGMDPPTIQSFRDVIIELLEGGFLDTDVVQFEVQAVEDKAN